MKQELQKSKEFFDEKLKKHSYKVLDTEFFDGTPTYLKYVLPNSVELYMYSDGECHAHKEGSDPHRLELPDYDSIDELREDAWLRLLFFLDKK